MTVEIVIFAAVLLGVLGGFVLERFRVRVEGMEAQRAATGNALVLPRSRTDTVLALPSRSPTAQLQYVSDARFVPRRLISANEEQIFEALERIICDLDLDWRVMAQVALAEIVESGDTDAVAAIGDQRVPLLIVSALQMPLAAVEYQTLGQVRDEGTLRGAIRREALRRADIDHIEIRSSDTPEMLRDQIRRLAARLAAVGSLQPIISPAPAEPAPSRKPRTRPAGSAS